jgi:hypothetical protein
VELIYKVRYEHGVKSIYNKRNKSLLIGNETVQDKVGAIADIVIDHANADKLIQEFVGQQKIDPRRANTIRKLTKEFIKESILSCIGSSEPGNNKFENIRDLDVSNAVEIQCLLNILGIVYDEINTLYDSVRPAVDEVSSRTMAIASELLSLLEANYAMQRLSGGTR